MHALGTVQNYFNSCNTKLFGDSCPRSPATAGVGQVNLSRLYLHGLGFIENIILTFPLGWGIKRHFHHYPLLGLGLTGLLVGASIESLQYFMSQHWLINRSSDINDVIANATGILIGGPVAATFQFVAQHRKTSVTDY